MTIHTGKHVVLFPVHCWGEPGTFPLRLEDLVLSVVSSGHTRTMCTLAARFVKLRQVTVTFFTVPAFYDRVRAEIDREFLPGEEHLASRLRLVPGIVCCEVC